MNVCRNVAVEPSDAATIEAARKGEPSRVQGRLVTKEPKAALSHDFRYVAPNRTARLLIAVAGLSPGGVALQNDITKVMTIYKSELCAIMEIEKSISTLSSGREGLVEPSKIYAEQLCAKAAMNAKYGKYLTRLGGKFNFNRIVLAALKSRSIVKRRGGALAHRDGMREMLSDERGSAPDVGAQVLATLVTIQAALDRLSTELGHEPERRAAIKALSAADIKSLSQADILARLFSYANFHKLEQSRRVKRPEVMAKLAAGKRLSVTEREMLAQRRTPLMHKKLLERRCPPPSVAFLTVANNFYVPGLMGLLLSLLDIYPDLQSDVLVYHDGTLGPFLQRQLTDIYPRVCFFAPDVGWLKVIARESDNHKRIGKLGYMNLYAFTHEEYDRVIALDSDLLIVDDISALWDGCDDDFRACLDCGDREYAAMSDYTGAYIINSGVISIPKRYLNDKSFEDAKAVARSSLLPLNDLIDRFADQKTWNMFLRDKPVTLLDVNYNCNVKYVTRHLGGNMEGVSIIHFTGAKPWNTHFYLNDEFVTEDKSTTLAFPKIWSDHYRRLLFRSRLKQFRRDTADNRRLPILSHATGETPTCVMIGNGPSIAQTPLELMDGLETFCFNWFILHERFEQIRPQHLVLASHMFFGGWNAQQPKFPNNYLAKLRGLKHRPVLWLSYYFKPLIDELQLADEFEINYLLFEKPFKRFVDGLGATHCDIDGFLDDGRTGVLSFGAPIAAALGFHRVVLVGCDSNYNAGGSGSNYFYDGALHTSLSTKAESLTATWQSGGAGHFAYEIVREALGRKGIEMLDATIGGGLTLPKMTVDELVCEAQRARHTRSAPLARIAS